MYIPAETIIAIIAVPAALWLLFKLAQWRDSRTPGYADLKLAKARREWARQDFEQWRLRHGERGWEEFQRVHGRKFKSYGDPTEQVFGGGNADLRDLADHWPETDQQTKDRRGTAAARKQAETEAAAKTFSATADHVEAAQLLRRKGLGDGDAEAIARARWVAARTEDLKAEQRRADAEEKEAEERLEAIALEAAEWADAMTPNTEPTLGDRQHAEDCGCDVMVSVNYRLFHQRCRELQSQPPASKTNG